MGFLAVASGAHDIVVICGVERMTHVERDTVTRALATAADWELEGVCGETFLSLNATLMRRYMQKYAVTAQQFAPFAVTAHRNALTNPNALLHKSIDADTYMASRLVADPIRLFDVSPICNGSAALVLVAPHLASDVPPDRRIRIAGSALATAPLALARRSDPLHLSAVTQSTQQAMRQARIGHSDVDVFELHDAYTIMTVLALEAAGFAAPGAGLELADDTRIGLHGELPLATFGGLKARGHPVGASGCYQLVEACLQLSERAGDNQVRNATVALTQNIGGTGATVVSHVLTRSD
jgi:acetyl-CoA C-acetyltransferase